MNPEKQRIAIAEACGWKRTLKPVNEMEEVGYAHMRKEYWDEVFLPAYLNDLNAMHEAEKTLVASNNPDWIIRYSEELHLLIAGSAFISRGCFAVICAPPAQRAEAFLRTIGKWEEE